MNITSPPPPPPPPDPFLCTAICMVGHDCTNQVRSECLTCTFRVSCCSARLSRAQVPVFAGTSVRDRNHESGRFQCSYGQARETTQHLLGPYLTYFWPTKFKTHYVAPQIFIFGGPSKFPSLKCAHISLLA